MEELSSLYDQLFTEESLYHWNYLEDELNKATCIINACDSGELGEAFFELFYEKSKNTRDFSREMNWIIFCIRGLILVRE